MKYKEFVNEFLKWYEDKDQLPDVVNNVKLDNLALMARDLEGCGLGESIQRVLKTYKIKKKRKKISKYL